MSNLRVLIDTEALFCIYMRLLNVKGDESRNKEWRVQKGSGPKLLKHNNTSEDDFIKKKLLQPKPIKKQRK